MRRIHEAHEQGTKGEPPEEHPPIMEGMKVKRARQGIRRRTSQGANGRQRQEEELLSRRRDGTRNHMNNPKKGTRNAKRTEKEKKGTEGRQTRNEEAKQELKAKTSNTTRTHRGEEHNGKGPQSRPYEQTPKGLCV